MTKTYSRISLEESRRLLKEAINSFPIISWYQQYAPTYDSGTPNVYADCAICNGKRKLGISLEKRIFHCFRCLEGQHGGTVWSGSASLVKMVSILENKTTREAIRFILDRAGIPEIRIHRTVTVPESKLPSEAMELSRASSEHDAIKMMHRRGVAHLIPTSYICVDGKYSHRVILPCHYLETVTGFEAKTYLGLTPKALYPEWFKTGDTVYTTLDWDHNDDSVIITESIFDAETLGRNAIGLYGSRLHDGQLLKILELRKLGVRRLIWLLDFDAWLKQSKLIISKTNAFFDNFVCPIEGKDPNDIGRDASLKLVKEGVLVRDEFDIMEVCGRWNKDFV